MANKVLLQSQTLYMSRIFSINFLFRHQFYPALVSFQQKGLDSIFVVRYLDGDMKSVFSDGKLVLSPSGKIESKICGPQKLGEALAFSTREAINKYLNGERSFAVATKF